MAYVDPPDVSTGELADASLWDTYVRGNFRALGRDSHAAVVVGTAGGMGERWYWAGISAHTNGTTSTQAITTGSFYSVPFTVPYGQRTLDRIAVNVTTLAGSGVARLGIYAATSETDPYPSALVVDAGEFSTATTGVKSQTVSAVLEPDVLYWASFIAGTAGPTLLSLLTDNVFLPVLGTDSGLTNAATILYIRRTQTYGALPSTYPAGPPTTFVSTGPPAIGLRFSA